jgi:hypothetical protein
VLVGCGKTQNYAALVLFLAGMAAVWPAVYYAMIGGRWLIPTALALLLLFAGMGLVAAKKDE